MAAALGTLISAPMATLKGPVGGLSFSKNAVSSLYFIHVTKRMMGLLAAGLHLPSFHTMGEQFR